MGMGGIQRTFHIPRYLGELGWRVKIYTPFPPQRYPIDKNLEASSLEVIRTFSPDPLHLIPRKISTPGMGRRDYLSFPDNKVSWLPILMRSLESMDIVVTTCPPFSLFFTGFFIKNTPWIIDFRDPWTGGYLGEYKFGWEEKFANILEKHSIRRASAVISVTKNHTEYLRTRYPESREKIHLIRNGYNEDSFPEAHSRAHDKDIVITYMGTFNNLLPPDCIFEGLRELFKIKVDIKNRIVFKHIGYSSVGSLDKWVERVGLRRIISTGYLPHHEALKELLDSDVLLLLGAKGEGDNWIVPGKLYEYIRSGIPIVAITNNKEIEELIGSSGLRCDFNPAEIAQGILEIIKNRDSFKPCCDYRNYLWKNHAREYSKILVSVL